MKPLMNRIAFLSGIGFLLVFGYAGNHTIHAETVEPQTQETTEDVDPLEPMEPTEEPEQTQTKPVSQNEGTDEEIQSDPVLEEEGIRTISDPCTNLWLAAPEGGRTDSRYQWTV